MVTQDLQCTARCNRFTWLAGKRKRFTRNSRNVVQRLSLQCSGGSSDGGGGGAAAAAATPEAVARAGVPAPEPEPVMETLAGKIDESGNVRQPLRHPR